MIPKYPPMIWPKSKRTTPAPEKPAKRETPLWVYDVLGSIFQGLAVLAFVFAVIMAMRIKG